MSSPVNNNDYIEEISHDICPVADVSFNDPDGSPESVSNDTHPVRGSTHRNKGSMSAADRLIRRPVANKGDSFKWTDNSHVNRSCVKIGKRNDAALKLDLEAKTGKVYTYTYPRAQIDWNSVNDISSINKWRQQILRRRFGNQDEFCTPRNLPRAPWSAEQVSFLVQAVKDKISEKQTSLNKADWEAVAATQNNAFVNNNDNWMPAGTPLVQTTITRRGHTMVSAAAPLATATRITVRTGTGIRAILQKLPNESRDINNHLLNVLNGLSSPETVGSGQEDQHDSGDDVQANINIDDTRSGGDESGDMDTEESESRDDKSGNAA